MSLNSLNQHDFGSLLEQHQRELQVHCYRMLGSIQDAEDMVQETFLRAWKRRDSYVEDISLRAWLYRIATNLCLDALRRYRRRAIPVTAGPAASAADPIPAEVREPVWLEPYPDEQLAADDDHPEQQVIAKEHISIAFLAMLHCLPPRQRAVLILSDVLDWSASEVAGLLDTTVPAVRSALHRARSTITSRPYGAGGDDALAVRDTLTQAQLEDYVRAWESGDVDRLIRLLSDDVTFSMPPIPSWYQGRDSVQALVSKTIFAGPAAGRWRLLPARANRQLAFGLYRQTEGGGHAAYGIQVLTVRAGLITDIITFRAPALASRFSLPPDL